MFSMIRSKLKKYYFLLCLILVEIIIFYVQNNKYLYLFYKDKFYIPFSLFLRNIMSQFKFSVGDLLYLGSFIVFLTYFIYIIYHIRVALIKKIYIFYYLKKLLIILLLFHIIFKICWGINYENHKFTNNQDYQLNLDYNFTEVNNTRIYLIQQLNATRAKLSSEDLANLTNEKIMRQSYDVYKSISLTEPEFYLKRPLVKFSNFPEVVNIFGFSGYFNPFTNEAQIRYDNPLLLNPLICIHEIAHQLGYSSEIEASCVSEYICLKSDNYLFNYSSLCDLYLYFLSESYFLDSANNRNFLLEDSKHFSADVNHEINGIIKKLQTQRSGFIFYSRKLFREIYNYFLIFNNQSQGLKSYDIIIGWYINFIKEDKKKKP